MVQEVDIRQTLAPKQPALSPLFRRPYVPMVLVALTVRLAVIPFLYREWLDPFVIEHWAFGRVARSILLGHGFSNVFADTGATALLPPVYCYVVAAVFRIFGDHTAASIIATLALNCIFSALVCVPVFLIAKNSFGDKTAKWTGWAWAFSPYGIYFSADWAWSTPLLTLLLSVLFLLTIHLENTTSTRSWLAFGLLSGVAALTEPVCLSTLPFLGVLSWFRLRRRNRRWFRPGMTAVLATAAVLAPWFIRNYQTFHQFIPVRSGFGLELYLGNSGDSSHWADRTVHPNHSDAELEEYARVGEVAYMAHKKRQALDFIGSHRLWFVWVSLRRVVYMWTGYWSFDPRYLAQEPLDPPNVFVGTALSALALTGLYRAFRNNRAVAIRFAIAFFFFPLVYYISHPEAYYFRPLDPLLTILAVYAVIVWKQRSRPQVNV
jgi:4-amino-4-deoxy-L-arabinose transferase-like glycosyltransferase